MQLYPKLILDALAKVRYPGNGKDLVANEMIEDDIRIDGNKVSFSIIFDKPTDPFIRSVVKAAETAILTFVSPEVNIKGNIAVKARQTARPNPENPLPDVKNIIAVSSGKGGVGKTTLCGMLIQYLCEQGKGPILAVDADANSNLNEVLGVEVETTLGDVREEIAQAELVKESPIPKGMSKADYAEMRFEDALTEEDDFDLLVMGRTQGKGCYCYVNGLLQAQLAKYQNHYPYIVVDNEAGMEHISRGVLPSMQTAILVSDCSRRGIQAVGRIAKLIDECNMHPESVGLIVNRAPKGELNDGIKEEIEKQGLHLLGVVPQDDTVYEYDCEGRPTASLPEDNPVKAALKEIIKNLNL